MKKQKNQGGYFDIISKKNTLLELQQEMSKEIFWNNREKAEAIIDEFKNLKREVDNIEKLSDDVKYYFELLDIYIEEGNTSEIKNLEKNLFDLKKRYDEFEVLCLLNKEYDKCNCIVEIHPGAGGTESCDWALMLFRMYTRWFDKNDYKYEIVEYQEGEEAGIKSVTLNVRGQNAYGYLKHEKGIHRLVRISPFDSNKRRHTSFVSVDIFPEIKETNSIEINEKDLKIDVYRSSGAGGQHVNTTDSAVRITHLPTKTVVTCQNGRSQIQNKEQAMQILKSKLLILKEKETEEKIGQLKGEQESINFGSQIRSYVIHPYTMVKDHRTNIETSEVNKVLDGEIDLFIRENIRRL